LITRTLYVGTSNGRWNGDLYNLVYGFSDRFNTVSVVRHATFVTCYLCIAFVSAP